MSLEKATLPSLPKYQKPGIPVAGLKDQGPLMKVMGKMLAKRLPRLMNNPKIHSQSVKIKQKKVKYW